MTWAYTITTGAMAHDGELAAHGYSGHEDCRNDPAKCSIPNAGPIPPGRYTIGEPRDTERHGPFVLPLTPADGNEMFGRSGFLIHGDSLAHPGAASEGCIILPRAVREAIHDSGDNDLEVTA